MPNIDPCIDPWEKAADCARALQTSSDPQRRAILQSLQNMWVALANERNMMTPEEVSIQVQAINGLQLELAGSDTRH